MSKRKKRELNPWTLEWESKTEKDEWTSIASKLGYRTLSKFVRDCVDTVKRDPSILEPTEEPLQLPDVYERLKEAQKSFYNEYQTVLSQILDRLDTVERYVEVQLTPTQKRKLRKQENIGEEVFAAV